MGLDVIDLIVERMKSRQYNPWDFYYRCVDAGKVAEEVVWAMDEGIEDDVRKALCRYIKNWRYHPLLCDYVNRLDWLCTPGREVEERATQMFMAARNTQEMLFLKIMNS